MRAAAVGHIQGGLHVNHAVLVSAGASASGRSLPVDGHLPPQGAAAAAAARAARRRAVARVHVDDRLASSGHRALSSSADHRDHVSQTGSRTRVQSVVLRTRPVTRRTATMHVCQNLNGKTNTMSINE